MTAIADPPAAADAPPDEPAPVWTPPVPVATMFADLMPDEIVVKRRLAYLKRRLVFVMAALIALVVLGDMLVRQQTSSAQSDLSGANNHIATLNQQLDRFDGMLATQNETQAIRTQLDGVMSTDVSWPQLLDKLAGPAPAGLRLTSVVAQVADPDSTTGAAAGPTSALPDTSGSITMTGIAPSWSDVATYVRGLSAVEGFTAVNPSTVSNGAGGPGTASGALTFTVTLDLTSAALSNRYTAAATPGTTTPGTTTPGTTTPAHHNTLHDTLTSKAGVTQKNTQESN